MAIVTAPFCISSKNFEPAYLALYRTGELQHRAQVALQWLTDCHICPRACGNDRTRGGMGVCKIGRYAHVSSYFPHMGEEDCLRGWNGSGTIFFASCSLRCAFCQNFDVSHGLDTGTEMRPGQLAAVMLELQANGCHNINLVTPGHVLPQILEALVIAVKQGLRLPIVYNTSGYDTLDTLRLLDGVVDIYMPDFKLWDAEVCGRYLHARNYASIARAAVREMHRQVGDLCFDEDGLAKRGLLVRHLVMPGRIADTAAIMDFLATEVSPDTYVNVMSQYYPAGKVNADRLPEINRRITPQEYATALQHTQAAGIWRVDERRPGQPWIWG